MLVATKYGLTPFKNDKKKNIAKIIILQFKKKVMLYDYKSLLTVPWELLVWRELLMVIGLTILL
jgi:hypothetical protein